MAEEKRLQGFFDGASRGNPGIAGAGALLGEEGKAPLWEGTLFLGTRTNNEAEYEGLLLLLREIATRDLRGVAISGDSKLVISQMNLEWKVRQPHLQILWREARELAKGRKLSFSWVPRSRNASADALSNRAIDEQKAPEPKGSAPGAGDLPEGFQEIVPEASSRGREDKEPESSSRDEDILFTPVGEHIYLARGSEEYAVDLKHNACTCPGFQFRRKCRHLREARRRFGGEN